MFYYLVEASGSLDQGERLTQLVLFSMLGLGPGTITDKGILGDGLSTGSKALSEGHCSGEFACSDPPWSISLSSIVLPSEQKSQRDSSNEVNVHDKRVSQTSE